MINKNQVKTGDSHLLIDGNGSQKMVTIPNKQLRKVTNNKFGFFRSKEEYDPSLKPRSFGEMTIQEYMSERLNDQIKYYDKTANRSKKRYLRNRLSQ